MNLYEHQSRFLLKNPRKMLLAWSTGVGKTRASILWACQNSFNTLVVCPKGLVTQWERQIALWSDPRAKFTVISKETFKLRPQKRHDAIIADEADHFFSARFKSALSKSLRDYIKKHSPALLLLTGTPYRSSAWNIYTAALLLGHNWNYREFEVSFFHQVYMGMRLISLPKKDKKTSDRLKQAILKIADVVKLEECADIPEQVEDTIVLGLTKEQEKAKALNQEIVPISRFTKDHQVEAEYEHVGYKLDRILRILEEKEKIIAVCRYLKQMDYLLDAIPGKVFVINGATKNRQFVIDSFEKEKNATLICQADLCEGWESPSCHTMVFASMGFSYRNFVQMRGRILRLNALHKNTYIFLLAGRADEAVMSAMKVGIDFDVLKHYN